MNQPRNSPDKVLVIGPDADLADRVSVAMRGRGLVTDHSESPEIAEELLRRGSGFKALVLRIGTSELWPEALQALRSAASGAPVLIYDPEPSVQRAVHAMRLGAADVLTPEDLTGAEPAKRLIRVIEKADLGMQQQSLDARMAYAERLANTARFSAGIARELNAAVSIVLANLNYLEEQSAAMQVYLRKTHRLMQDLVPPEAQAKLAARLEDHSRFLVEGTETIGAVRDSVEAVERIRKLVQDLKMLSAIEDEEPLTEQDPRELMESVLNLVFPLIASRARLEKDFAAVPAVRVQRSRVAQALLDILLNAVEAIPEGNPVEHRIRVGVRSTGDDLHITVRDTGVGIPPENLSRIFEPFFSTQRTGRGAGLGLSVARQVLLEHGGRVAVSSTPGEGTVVVMTLPLDGRVTMTPLHSGAVRKLIRAPMLLVDPDHEVLESYERLYGLVATVETAATAEQAWHRLKTGRLYDLVVVDLDLPDDGALDLLRRTIKAGLTDHLDRWVFSARDPAAAETEDGRIQGMEVLAKPLSFELIMKRLSEA